MAKYRFVAVNAEGKEVSGSVDCGSEAEVTELLRNKGMETRSVTAASGGNGTNGATKPAAGRPRAPAPKAKPEKKKPAPSKKSAPGGGAKAPAQRPFSRPAQKKGAAAPTREPGFMARVKPKELMTVTRQLATLVDAGLPLVRRLSVLQRQEKNPLMKFALADMSESINAGSTFAEAMNQHPRIFDKLYVNMVRAGELGGVLDKVLISLAEFMEKLQKIKNKVVSAMVYPVVVLVMALGILFFLMLVIIPKFEKIFDDILGGKLPPLTQFVMYCSENLVTGAPFILAGVIAFAVGVHFVKKTEKGEFFFDTLKLRAPLFGPLMRKSAIARFARTLSTLMDSGVPVLQALTIVGETSGNAVISRGVMSVHDAVKEGENMAPPIDSTGLFPPMVVSMVEVGEETGDLPQMLYRIADTYDDEVDNAVAALTSVIEPILIIFLAVIVGTIVIALFMPLISIIGGLS